MYSDSVSRGWVTDENALVREIIRELAESGFGDARVRQILDMTTATRYSEDYSDPKAEVFAFALAGGIFPRPANHEGPESFYDFLKTVRKQGEHGRQFFYKSVDTGVLGWLIARVTGRNAALVLQERIWIQLGAEMDAYVLVDSAGTGWAAGGLNATLRNHARFGKMMRRDGRWNGRQIVPESVVADIRKGGSKADFAKAGYGTLPGWSYRNQWWISHDDHGAFTARGVHGQIIYIDPKAEILIVRLASSPQAANARFDEISLGAHRAIAERLLAR